MLDPIILGIVIMALLAKHAIDLRTPKEQPVAEPISHVRITRTAWEETVDAALLAHYERLAREHAQLMRTMPAQWDSMQRKQVIRKRAEMRECEQDLTNRGLAIPACD